MHQNIKEYGGFTLINLLDIMGNRSETGLTWKNFLDNQSKMFERCLKQNLATTVISFQFQPTITNK